MRDDGTVAVVVTLKYGDLTNETKLPPGHTMPPPKELAKWARQVRDAAHPMTGFSIREVPS